jgi:hypothetical protein
MDRAQQRLVGSLSPYPCGGTPYSGPSHAAPRVVLGKGTEPVRLPPRVDYRDERPRDRVDDVVLCLPIVRRTNTFRVASAF